MELRRPRGCGGAASRPPPTAVRAATRAAVAALVLAIPAALDAQATVRSARLSAELVADGSASVTIEYELTGASDPLEVEVALLGFDDATSEELLADGRSVPLTTSSGSRRSAPLSLEGSIASGDRRRVTLAYRVDEATALLDGRLRTRIPVATISLPAAADSGTVFHARLVLPEGWSVLEGFPTGLVATEPRVYTTGLRVVPSVVSLRGRTDGDWRPGVKLLVDLLAVSILLGVGVLGWRHMRGMSA